MEETRYKHTTPCNEYGHEKDKKYDVTQDPLASGLSGTGRIIRQAIISRLEAEVLEHKAYNRE